MRSRGEAQEKQVSCHEAGIFMTGKFWVGKVASRRLREQQGLQEEISQLTACPAVGLGGSVGVWWPCVMGEAWAALGG